MNKMFRAALLVLALILVSVCCIGGTYAKYTSGSQGGDSARVAKWGITKDFESGALFQSSYGETVSSSDSDHVAAPGTDSSYIFALSGTPEVSYVVRFGLEGEPKDMTLFPGTYTFGPAYQNMTVIVEKDYLPLKWTVEVTTANGTFADSKDVFHQGENGAYTATFDSLKAVQTALADLSVTYATNEECDVEVKLAWEWPFEDKENAKQNKMDTVLGYYISQAEKGTSLPFETTADKAAITNVTYTFTMTATQLD